MNRPVCLEGHNYQLAHIWLLIFLRIITESNIDLVVSILRKINFNPHKKPIPLLYVAPCTQSMQRIWWPVASTTIVTGSYHHILRNGLQMNQWQAIIKKKWAMKLRGKHFANQLCLSWQPNLEAKGEMAIQHRNFYINMYYTCLHTKPLASITSETITHLK